jgi:hypothetical protein
MCLPTKKVSGWISFGFFDVWLIGWLKYDFTRGGKDIGMSEWSLFVCGENHSSFSGACYYCV